MASFVNENMTNLTSTAGPGHIVLATRTQFIIVALCYFLIFVTGIIGNSMVIAAVALCRKLQTATNVFVVSLAVTDLLSCLTLPFQAVSFLNIALPDGLCAFIGAISIICLMGSIITLGLIAFNRCYLITQSRKSYSWLYTSSKLCVMTAIAWLYPLVFIVIPQAAGVGQLGYSPSYKACLWNENHPLAFVSDIMVAITFFFTFVIIVVCYVKIWIYINRHIRRLRFHASTRSTAPISEQQNLDDLSSTQDHHTDTQVSSPVSGNGQGNSNQSTNGKKAPLRRARSVSSREIEITKNLFYVVCAFILCIIPYTVTLTLPASPFLDSLVLYASVPLVFNGCVNPVIYAYKHPTMRVVFRYLLKCQVSSIPKPSKCLRRALSFREQSEVGMRSEGHSKNHEFRGLPDNVQGDIKDSPLRSSTHS